ncbi:hypothetical protein [Clostridium sp.]|uniref:hypothetical protein n=1 Tax=Clostridium sp. TaxID=1506 RepID=UPI001A417673|nr:hypothetical protein [Clostridium sp.]MBK5241915.1 hypothetical protein [Clostridium sp.]
MINEMEEDNNEIDEYAKKFNMINFYLLQNPIQKMLSYKQPDFKIKVVTYLISFFYNNLGYSLKKVIQIMTVWKNLNVPSSEDMNIISIVNMCYGKQISYSSNLCREFGYINFNDYSDRLCIKVPNEVIERFPTLHDCSYRIYIAIAIFCKLNEVGKCTKKEIEKVAMISEKTLERRIGELIKEGLIGRKMDKGIVYYTLINSIILENGFIKINIKSFQRLLADKIGISDGAIKVYTFMKYNISHEIMDVESNEYQKRIGAMTGKKKNTISNITTILKGKGYIKKRTYRESRYNVITGKREQTLRCGYQIE